MEDILKERVYPRSSYYGWLRFTVEISRQFLIPYLIRKEKLLLLPLHDSKGHSQFKDKNEAIECLQKGTNLVETLDSYNKEGTDLLNDNKQVDALEAFWKGFMCLDGRMGDSLDGDNINKSLSNVENLEILEYLKAIKCKELELLKVILKCLSNLGKPEEAVVVKQILVMNFPDEHEVQAFTAVNLQEEGSASKGNKDMETLRETITNGCLLYTSDAADE